MLLVMALACILSLGAASFSYAQGSGGTVDPSPAPTVTGGGGTVQPTQTAGITGGGGTVTGSGSTFAITNPLNANSIGEVVLSFIQIFSYVVILLAVLCLIYVGFQYILASAQGDSGKIKELHGYLLYIVIGIAIVIGARVIVEVVINTLAATGTVNSGVINGARNALPK